MQVGNVPEELRCSECKGILKEPQIATCGHYFCKGCVEEKEKCVKCKKIIHTLKFSDRKAAEIERYFKSKRDQNVN
ncbi:hypothetical protein A0H76_2578 [Hepatospora eriocheir]|nr:hypothetical protein A0H76_1089 [Hepatospora eriocheir]ORD98397.1 hypothetical protein A0H76_2578 [Hepatospora eriocheir]